MHLRTLASGSSGNCTVVSHGETHILVDAGISAKRMKLGLEQLRIPKASLSGIAITHEHGDHVKGLEVFLKNNDIPVFASHGTGRALMEMLPHLRGRIHTFTAGDSFHLKDLALTSFPTSHDTEESVGYRVTDGKVHAGIVTDLGCITKEVEGAIDGLDLLLLEANYDRELLTSGPYPAFLKYRVSGLRGHLSNEDAGRLALSAAKGGVRQIILAHLSAENNLPRMARDAVLQALDHGRGMVPVDVAPRGEAGPVYTIGAPIGEANAEHRNLLCGKTEGAVLHTGGR